MTSTDQQWRTYEEVARFLLGKIAEELGLEHVEGAQSITGQRSGTSWRVDAKGVCVNGTGFVVIEIRRHTTRRLVQESLAGIAYRVLDTGAIGGIVVSPMGLQEGASKIAGSEGIVEVQLDENSTTTEFIMRFLGRVMIGLRPDALTVSATIIGGSLVRVRNDE